MGGYVRKRDRWGVPDRRVSAPHCTMIHDPAIDKSMANTCPLALMMEILTRHSFAAPARIHEIGPKLHFFHCGSIGGAESQMLARGWT